MNKPPKQEVLGFFTSETEKDFKNAARSFVSFISSFST